MEEIQSDYGIDFDVEVFHAGKTTGIIFRVQLKSSESTYSRDGSYIPERMSLSNARHLCAESQKPTLLVHSDVRNQKFFLDRSPARLGNCISIER